MAFGLWCKCINYNIVLTRPGYTISPFSHCDTLANTFSPLQLYAFSSILPRMVHSRLDFSSILRIAPIHPIGMNRPALECATTRNAYPIPYIRLSFFPHIWYRPVLAIVWLSDAVINRWTIVCSVWNTLEWRIFVYVRSRQHSNHFRGKILHTFRQMSFESSTICVHLHTVPIRCLCVLFCRPPMPLATLTLHLNSVRENKWINAIETGSVII